MSKEDIILIKIGQSYKEGMTAEEIYNATSVSWKISNDKLQTGDFNYFGAVYNNKIIEFYELIGFEKDSRPDKLGRKILKGKVAEESIRSKLLEKDLGDIHKGKGNPIKYYSLDLLVSHVDSLSENEAIDQDTLFDSENDVKESEIKKLFIGLASNTKEINTLGTSKPNWITKVDDMGIYVETLSSREKYSKGEKKRPYYFITFDFLLEAWYEFVSIRKASAGDFLKTKGRSSFVMAFFNELPFVEKVEENNSIYIYIKLLEFTTDQLPETSLEQVVTILGEIINENLDPKTISQKFQDEAKRRLKNYARQGLKILGILTEDYIVQNNIVNEYKASFHKYEYLSGRMRQHPYLTVILKLLALLKNNSKNEILSILTEIGMLIVRNSVGSNQMLRSASEKRTRFILNWFRDTELVDEEWDLLQEEKIVSPTNGYTIDPNADMVLEDRLKMLPINEIITHIDKYIASKGFYYETQEIQNLYLSLRTKPFVILSGISGTGKTMIIKWFAESVGATEENGQFSLISVRPDWNDGSDVLGYVDIAGNFKEGPLTTTIKNALDHPDRPYFVLLDEMNLARVEYYFSDVLSVMESREFKNGRIVTSPLLNAGTAANGSPIYFPENVYIIGTVNMDETTHPFSKKVLDRANTIEFNEVKLDYLEFLGNIPSVDPIKLHNNSFRSSYIHLKDVYLLYSDLVEDTTKELVNINNILKTIGAHVGYRVRDEICFYLAFNKQGDVMTFEQALDRCILQKILPRISGSDTRVDRTLRGLYKYFTGNEIVQDLEVYEADIQIAKYPMCAAKTFEMLRRLRDDGFTSFWIS
jgi:hypothetical protein